MTPQGPSCSTPQQKTHSSSKGEAGAAGNRPEFHPHDFCQYTGGNMLVQKINTYLILRNSDTDELIGSTYMNRIQTGISG